MYAYVYRVPVQFVILSLSCCSIILQFILEGLSPTYGSLRKRQKNLKVYSFSKNLCKQKYLLTTRFTEYYY